MPTITVSSYTTSTTLPSTCVYGQVFRLSDGSVYVSTADNVWTQVSTSSTTTTNWDSTNETFVVTTPTVPYLSSDSFSSCVPEPWDKVEEPDFYVPSKRAINVK